MVGAPTFWGRPAAPPPPPPAAGPRPRVPPGRGGYAGGGAPPPEFPPRNMQTSKGLRALGYNVRIGV
ncbi:hypothetical protein WOC75_25610 [Klebsiella pneumoniae]|uniref:hypothetical protein n=1 Tax=Klebsiella pneumoniae TaxID=573 RepID=UPI0030EFC971